MKQEVVASADVWKGDINDTGHAAVYGTYFDTGQAVIKLGSERSLEEIAKLLQQNPRMLVLIVGHTDSTGEIAHISIYRIDPAGTAAHCRAGSALPPGVAYSAITSVR